MAMKINGIESEDELRKAQAAAQASGSTITNYQEWADILSDLKLAGVDSTGSYKTLGSVNGACSGMTCNFTKVLLADVNNLCLFK